MKTTHQRQSRFLLSCLALLLPLLGGCAGMMKELEEKITDQKVDYEPEYTIKLDARSQPAKPTEKENAELEKEFYVYLGYMTVKYINEVCFPGEKCETESHSNLPTDRLLVEAQNNGADVARLRYSNRKGSGQAVKNGRCIRTELKQVPYQECNYETNCDRWGCTTRQTYCTTKYRSQNMCVEWEKIYGTEFYTESAGSIWRLDKTLQAQVKFVDRFHEAVLKGQLSKVKEYVSKGIRVDIPDIKGRYPLMVAVEANQTAVAKFALDNGANPEFDNSRALVHAAKKNNTELVGHLLKAGADPDAKIGFLTVLFDDNSKNMEEGQPLMAATGAQNMEMTRLLLEAGANPNVEDGAPLKSAIKKNNRGMIKLLLKHNASINEDGIITQVVMNNDPELLQAFLERGANPDLRTWSGKTPLQEAATRGYVELMSILIKHGADLNKRGVGGEHTPLMMAAVAGQVEAVKLLIESNADLNVVNVPTGLGLFSSMLGVKSLTALELARGKWKYATGKSKADYQKIIDMLVAAGAK